MQGKPIKNINPFTALFARSEERADQRSVVGVSSRRKCIEANIARRGLTRSSLSRSTYPLSAARKEGKKREGLFKLAL